MSCLINLVVELNGKKYICWYYEDEYDMETALHLTPIEDWEKLQKEYPDEMDRYYQFSGFIYSYDEIKESIEEMSEEDTYGE